MRAARDALLRSLSGFSLAHFSLAFVGLLWTLPFLQLQHYFPMPMFRSEWPATPLRSRLC